MPAKILILGGTRDAREIAAALVAEGHDVTTSLAGVTASPLLPMGKVKTGGFGGTEGLRDYLLAQNIEVLVDATHPFAAIISRNAVTAAAQAGVRLLRFERPPWSAQAGDRWINVSNIQEAVDALPQNARVLLTIGRKEIAPFLARKDLSGKIRTIEPPEKSLPSNWRLIRERPPFSLESETSLLRDFTHLVTKNAGGNATAEKLLAARELGLPVVMIERPQKTGAPTVSRIEMLVSAISTSSAHR